MSTQESRTHLQATLDLVVLCTLISGPQRGQGISHSLQQTSDEELAAHHGAIRPALQRLEECGCIPARRGNSASNRKVRFYSLTCAGRKQMVKEAAEWKRLATCIKRILEPEVEEG